jgi:hypothetical protein
MPVYPGAQKSRLHSVVAISHPPYDFLMSRKINLEGVKVIVTFPRQRA